MAEPVKESRAVESIFAASWIGTVLTVLSGLSFLLVCMILPLVGKAGLATSYAQKNKIAFVIVVVIATALAVLATLSKLARRKIDASPLPVFSLVLLLLCVLLIVALFAGLLSI